MDERTRGIIYINRNSAGLVVDSDSDFKKLVVVKLLISLISCLSPFLTRHSIELLRERCLMRGDCRM